MDGFIRRFTMTATIEFEVAWPTEDDSTASKQELKDAYENVGNMAIEIRESVHGVLEPIGVEVELTTPEDA